MGQRLNCASTGRTDRSQELPLSERMDLYLGVAVTLMFLAGCFLIVLACVNNLKSASARESGLQLSPGRPQKASHHESE
jgi:hypothetical protein